MNAALNLMKRVLSAAALLSALAAGTVAHAQTEPTWNRSIDAIAVFPDGTGGLEIVAVVGATVENLMTFGDLSAFVMLSVDGSVVGSQTHQITSIPPTFPNPCSACLTNQPCACCGNTCFCGGFSLPAPKSWNVTLAPGSQISVAVIPAPGSLPEKDMSDNVLTFTYSGHPVYWQRRIVSVSTQPSSTPGLSDLLVEWEPLIFNVTHDMNMSTIVNVQVNAAFIYGADYCADNPFLVSPDQPCFADCGEPGAFCGNVSCGGIGSTLKCGLVDAGAPCGCSPSNSYSVLVRGLTLTPGDVVTVSLDPSQRGLPNLAGLPPLHVKTIIVPAPCPADINGDGVIGVADLLQLLSCWGPVVPGCQGADLTGDNVVGVADLLQLLAQWGPCMP